MGTVAHLAKRDEHVPLLLLRDATSRVTDRQLHKLLAWVATGHGLQHDSDAAVCGELGRIAHQVVQDLQERNIFQPVTALRLACRAAQ